MQVNLGVKSATYPNGEKLSDVYAYNHYGTETIPPRPVLSIAVEKVVSTKEMKDHLAAYAHNMIIYALNSPGDLRKTEIDMLVAIGQQAVAEAKRIILAGTELQENAPSTTRAKELKGSKGVGKPLYDSGLLIKNLGYEVTE